MLVDKNNAKERQKDIEKERETLERKLDDERKNKGFTQIYPKGWERIREILKKNPQAACLYSFFAEHIDPTCGAVVADQQFLANQMKVSIRTIQRWLSFLEEESALVRIPVAGKVCAYALDPHEVWKGYNNGKEYAAFLTKTLINKDGEIQRRIISMFSPEEKEEIGINEKQ
jgi:Fe2+ or Zn2+ uptake regulation protein